MINKISRISRSSLGVAAYYLVLLSIFFVAINTPNLHPTNTNNIVSLKPETEITYYFSAFVFICFICIYLGSKLQIFTRLIARVLAVLLLVVGLLGIIISVFSPCEGLSCIGNGIFFFFGATVVLFTLLLAPFFYPFKKPANRKISFLVALFILLAFFLLQVGLHLYLMNNYKQKLKHYHLSILAPAYIPKNMSENPREWYFPDRYEIEYSDPNLIDILYIKGRTQNENSTQLLNSGGRNYELRNTVGILKTIDLGNNLGISTLIWTEGDTEIEIQYTRNRPRSLKPQESVEQELLKIIESLKELN